LVRKETTDSSDQQRWEAEQKSISTQVMGAVKGLWLRHHTLEAALLLGCYLPHVIPYVNQAYQKIFLNSPQEFFGSAVDAFTFDCLFRQWACEWAIEAHRALEALDLIRQMIHQNNIRAHFPVEFRFCDEEDIALSPSVGRKTCWIGLVMYRPHGKDAKDTLRVYRLFCELMQRLGGRPHWAKYFQWRRNDVAAAYGGHWQRWLELRQQMDPKNTFVNEWLGTLLTQD
jgi:L-gulonolactone oxidase